MSVGVAQPEAPIEEGSAFTEMPVDLAAQIVFGMQRLGDDTEGHGFVARLQAEQPVHGRRPLHMAAGEVPAPDAAARQGLGQFLGQRAAVLARSCRSEIPEGAREQHEHETRQDEERDLETCPAPPIGERRSDRLDESQLRVGLRHIANRDDGVGAIEQRDAQDASLGPERGERLLGPQDGEKIARVRAVERRAALDVALGVGEEGGPAGGSRASGQARRERALPVGA